MLPSVSNLYQSQFGNVVVDSAITGGLIYCQY